MSRRKQETFQEVLAGMRKMNAQIIKARSTASVQACLFVMVAASAVCSLLGENPPPPAGVDVF